MKTKSLLLTLALSMAIAGSAHSAPNILLIIADDIGADAVSLQTPMKVRLENEEHDLPGLDMIRKAGIRFGNCYAEPACTPTRGSIYTGRHPYLSEAYHPNEHDLPVVTSKTTAGATFATVIGGTSGLFGKWHLGNDWSTQHPHKHGWTSWRGHKLGDPSAGLSGGSYTKWDYYTEASSSRTRTTVYAPDFHLGQVKDHITSWKNTSGGWCITYACSLAHSPYHIPPGNGTNSETKTQNFGDMVVRMDQNIEAIISHLEDEDELDDTVIIFVGDNGTDHNVTMANGDIGEKTELTRAGLRVPMIIAEGSRITIGDHTGGSASSATWVKKAGLETDFVHVVDIFSTIVDLAGKDVPSSGTIHSESLVPFLNGTDSDPPRSGEHVFSQWGASGNDESAWFTKDSGGKIWRLYHEGGAYKLYDVFVDDSADVYDFTTATSLFGGFYQDYNQVNGSAFPAFTQ